MLYCTATVRDAAAGPTTVWYGPADEGLTP